MEQEYNAAHAQNLDSELEIYQTYQDVIAPLVLTIEVIDGEFPIEILNEIRSIFTHLSRYKLQKDDEELVSAQRHVKRAVLDCYKYLCVSYFEEIKKFRQDYRGVDLRVADNGHFLPLLDEKEKHAKDILLKAKKFEIAPKKKNHEDKDFNELYALYEEAFLACSDLHDFLEISHNAISYASTQSKKTKIICWLSFIFGIIGTLMGIVCFFTSSP